MFPKPVDMTLCAPEITFNWLALIVNLLGKGRNKELSKVLTWGFIRSHTKIVLVATQIMYLRGITISKYFFLYFVSFKLVLYASYCSTNISNYKLNYFSTQHCIYAIISDLHFEILILSFFFLAMMNKMRTYLVSSEDLISIGRQHLHLKKDLAATNILSELKAKKSRYYYYF